MAKYKFTIKKGKKKDCFIEPRMSSSVGRWQRSAELEKSQSGAKTKIKTETTKSGLNKKVVQVITVYNDGTVIKADLVSNSNSLSKGGKK